MKINLIFPGQGAQFVGMGLDFYKEYESYREILQKTSEVLGEDLLQILQDEESLQETKNSQLAIFSMGYGISQLLKAEGLKIHTTLGLSLGEYSALAFAESFSLEEALALLKKRSQFMQEAVMERETFLLAVSFLDREKVLVGLQDHPEVYLANENAPNQNVVGGPKEKEGIIKEAMLQQGAKKVTSLRVAGAFHTPYMKSATRAFGEELKAYKLKDPKVPVLSNFKGDFYELGDSLEEILAHHISHPVKLGHALQALQAKEEDVHLIIGPGKAMASLIKQNKILGEVIKVGTLNELRVCVDKLKEKNHE